MPEPVQNLWSYQSGDFISAIAITSNGEYIIAGSSDKHIYCFDRGGTLLWQHEVEGGIYSLALAEGSQRILAGCNSGTAYLWDYTGKLLHTYTTDGGNVWGTAITPDAHFIALGTLGKTLYFYEEKTRLWEHKAEGPIRRISMTADGTAIAAGSEDNSIYLFNRAGTQLWRYSTLKSVWAGAHIIAGGYVAAGSNDNHLYLLDLRGRLLWKRDLGNVVNVIASTPDGRCIAAATGSGTVYLFSHSGEQLWSYKTGSAIYGLTVSADSRFVFVGSNDNRVYLLDVKGKCLWQRNTQREVFSVAISPDGQLLAAGSKNHTFYVFKNTAATSSSDVMPWTAYVIIRQVRQAYINNPHLGLAEWLIEFDRALLQKDIACCQALLTEIRQEGYQLTTQEQTYVDSREAALLLCRGIVQHRLKAYNEARKHYEASRILHGALGNGSGEGQAMLALDELNTQRAEPDTVLLEQLARSPHVLGDSSTLLSARLETLPLPEQILVIQAAKQCGLDAPLLKGLASPEPVVQAAAATALSWLSPGPAYETLTNTMLTTPNWLVRWQANTILQQRANKNQAEFTRHKESIHTALALRLRNDEQDPMVRRTIALNLTSIKNTADIPEIVSLLVDPDPDVRYAAVKALETFGNRSAQPALRQVADGRDFAGNQISTAAKTALQQIQQRLPPYEVQDIVLCREITAQGQPRQAMQLFLAKQPPLYCSVTIASLVPGTRVTCTMRERAQNRVVFQQVRTFTSTGQQEDEETLIELVHTTEGSEQSPVPHTGSTLVPGSSEVDRTVLEQIVRGLSELVELPSGLSQSEVIQRLRSTLLEQFNENYENAIVAVMESLAVPPEERSLETIRARLGEVRALVEEEDAFLLMVQGMAQIIIELLEQFEEETLALIRLMVGFMSDDLDSAARERLSTAFIELLEKYEDDFEAVGKPLEAYADAFMEGHTTSLIEVAHENLGTALTELLAKVGDEFVAIVYGRDDEDTDEETATGEAQLAVLLFSVTSTDPWKPGDHVVEIAIHNTIEAQQLFKISEQVALQQAVTCLACNSAGEPSDPATTFAIGEPIYCSVLLEHAPLGLELEAQINYIQKTSAPVQQKGFFLKHILPPGTEASKVMESKRVKTTVEGQHAVVFSWEAKKIFPGSYLIEIKTAQEYAACTIEIVPNQMASLPTREARRQWELQGESNYRTNHYGKALSAYEQMLRLDPRSLVAHIGKGDTLYRLNRFHEALAAYEQAIRLNVKSALAYTCRGETFFRLNRYKEALADSEQAIRLDPTSLLARLIKGRILLYREQPFEAAMQEIITIFDQNSQLSTSAIAYNCKGCALYYLNRFDEALATYKQGLDLEPYSAILYCNQGTIFRMHDDHAEALAAYEQAIQLDPHFAFAYTGKGLELAYNNRFEEALTAYEQAILLDPYDDGSLLAKSKVLTQLERFNEAQQALDAAQALKASR